MSNAVEEHEKEPSSVPFWKPVPIEIDDDYTFLSDNSLLFRLGSPALRRFAIFVLRMHNRLYFGLKIKGKEHLQNLPPSIITICNHVNMLDCSFIACTCPRRMLYFPTLKSNLELPFIRHLVKYLGGFPIPETAKAFRRFSAKIRDILAEGDSVHFFPEGMLRPYADNLLPFQRGAFIYAYDCNVPIVPFVITYRRPSRLRRLFRSKPPLTLHILEPVYPQASAPRREEADRLLRLCYERMSACCSREDSR